MSETLQGNGKKKNGVYITVGSVGGISVLAILWWVFQYSVLGPIGNMEPRLQSVEKEQAVLSARVLTKLESMDDRLRNIERGQRWNVADRGNP